MSEETVQDDTVGQYRLTYRVHPPAGCPVRECDGSVSELAVYQAGPDRHCELLLRDPEGNISVQEFSRPADEDCPCSVVVDHGSLPHFRPGDSGSNIVLTVYVNEASTAQAISEALTAVTEKTELIDYATLNNGEAEWAVRVELGLLTEKRRAALRRALTEGYYETPSETTIAEMAERTGISSSAFATRLRKAEREVFDQIRQSI